MRTTSGCIGSTLCTILSSAILYVIFLLYLVELHNYYNNPIEVFDCELSNIELEPNGFLIITANILDTKTNKTFETKIPCWTSEDCIDINDEYLTNVTMCAKRSISIFTDRSKAFVTPLEIPYYIGDTHTNITFWIFLVISGLICLVLTIGLLYYYLSDLYDDYKTNQLVNEVVRRKREQKEQTVTV